MCGLSKRRFYSPDTKCALLTSTQSDKIEALEKERSWKEDEFDFVLQSLRTILLKRRFDV